jgi:hypothetical protein
MLNGVKHLGLRAELTEEDEILRLRLQNGPVSDRVFGVA